MGDGTPKYAGPWSPAYGYDTEHGEHGEFYWEQVAKAETAAHNRTAMDLEAVRRRVLDAAKHECSASFRRELLDLFAPRSTTPEDAENEKGEK